MESVLTTIKAILKLDIEKGHKKIFLSRCLWMLSEVDGKYTTRYKSENSIGKSKGDVHHEHVFERKRLGEMLLKSSGNVKKIIKQSVGCVVTRTEHKKLDQVCRKNPRLTGWQRYKAAGIKVFDCKTGNYKF